MRTKERERVMGNTKSLLTAVLLATLTAAAQTNNQASPDQTPATVASQTAVTSAAAPPAAAPTAQALPPVVTMEDVVNRAIMREHALMDMLKTRNPLVETYLQNLKPDQQLGAVPKEDHYFLGRMDLGESVDRRDYLTKDSSFQKSMLGGVTKLFKFEYQPMGFSWMIFADREDFDRNHYEFKYVRREFLGDVRCLVFDITPKKDAGKGRFVGRV